MINVRIIFFVMFNNEYFRSFIPQLLYAISHVEETRQNTSLLISAADEGSFTRSSSVWLLSLDERSLGSNSTK